MKTQKAFSLVELIITLAVAAILLGLAVPSFTTMIQNNRMTSQANEFVASMHLARSEAVKRGNAIRIKAKDSGDAANEWGKGWTVWVDLNNNNTLDLNKVPPDGPEELRIVPAFDGTTALNGPDGTSEFIYKASGAIDATVEQPLDLCIKSGGKGRQITIKPSGRISMKSDYPCP